MKKIVMLLLLALSTASVFTQETVRIYGRVTDFNDNPIDSVTVRVKNKKFENLYETITDSKGYFSMNVLKDAYSSIYAIKLVDYGKAKLEYWAWNIPAINDLEINPKYERMEIYGVNAFEPQVGPFETYMVYFRPMSLTKSLELQGKGSKKELEKKAIAEKNTIDNAPITISKDELKLAINNQESEVVGTNKITEYARGSYMYGYLIQIKKPADTAKQALDYDKISIILHSKETNEQGMGECFVKRSK